MLLLDAFLETDQQFVAAFDDVFESGFRRYLAGKDLLHFTVFDVTYLRQIAQTYAARVFGRRGVQLFDRHIGAGILVVEAGFLGELEACLGDRHVPCALMPFSRLFRAGDVLEEFGHAFVDFWALLGKYPKRGAADNRVLGSALDVSIVGQGRCAELEVAGFDDVGAVAAGSGEHAAFSGSEQRVGRIAPAAIGKGAFLGHVGQEADVAHKQGLVYFKTGIQPAEAVVLRSVRRVVPGAKGLQLDPRWPRRGIAALQPGRTQLLAGFGNFFPGSGRVFGIK